MTTASTSAATKERASKAPSSKAGETDAIAMLSADHTKVKALFKEFKNIKDDGDDDEKSALVEQICAALTVHAELEEEIFYPAVREQIGDEDLMDEAEVEHAGAKDLIAQLESMDPGDDLYDAKVTVLGEQIDHHVKEEEGEMFPKVRKAKVDTASLGAEMAARKQELAPPEDDAPAAKATAAKRKR
jgi:hemerythrin superfamily protein